MRNSDFGAEKGLMVYGENHEKEAQGQLILERYNGVYSLRIYKFLDDEVSPYRSTFAIGERIMCPYCNNMSVSYRGFSHRNGNDFEQEHKDDCKFDKELFNEQFEKANLTPTRWTWGDGSYTLEEQFLLLFENSKFRRFEQFKAFKKLISKEEDRLLRGPYAHHR